MDVAPLADLLHETSERHGAFEAVAPPHDWWDWYAAYMHARQGGSGPAMGNGRLSRNPESSARTMGSQRRARVALAAGVRVEITSIWGESTAFSEFMSLAWWCPRSPTP